MRGPQYIAFVWYFELLRFAIWDLFGRKKRDRRTFTQKNAKNRTVNRTKTLFPGNIPGDTNIDGRDLSMMK